jgi:hypothetical protein
LSAKKKPEDVSKLMAIGKKKLYLILLMIKTTNEVYDYFEIKK